MSAKRAAFREARRESWDRRKANVRFESSFQGDADFTRKVCNKAPRLYYVKKAYPDFGSIMIEYVDDKGDVKRFN